MPESVTLPGGLKIDYWSHHPDKTPTIVMFHGFTGSHRGFRCFEPLLSDFHLIIPDIPGFGSSDLPQQHDWSIERLAVLMNQFIAQLDLPQPPILLGHSMGGLIASSMIQQQPTPHRQQLIVISPVPTAISGITDQRWVGYLCGRLYYGFGAKTGRLGMRVISSKFMSRFTAFGLIKTADTDIRRQIYQHGLYDLDVSSTDFYRAIYQEISQHGMINYADSLRQKDLLLITGQQDNVTPLKHIEYLAQAIDPQSLVTIPGAGHLIIYEKVPETVEAITQFIADKSMS